MPERLDFRAFFRVLRRAIFASLLCVFTMFFDAQADAVSVQYCCTDECPYGTDTPVASYQYSGGDTVTALSGSVCVAPNGYVFNSWLCDINRYVPSGGSFVMSTGTNVTCNAQWAPVAGYTVTYDCGTGSSNTPPASQTANQSNNFTVMLQNNTCSEPAGSAALFTGWYCDMRNDEYVNYIEEGVYDAGESMLVVNNTHCTAIWETQVSCSEQQTQITSILNGFLGQGSELEHGVYDSSNYYNDFSYGRVYVESMCSASAPPTSNPTTSAGTNCWCRAWQYQYDNNGTNVTIPLYNTRWVFDGNIANGECESACSGICRRSLQSQSSIREQLFTTFDCDDICPEGYLSNTMRSSGYYSPDWYHKGWYVKGLNHEMYGGGEYDIIQEDIDNSDFGSFGIVYVDENTGQKNAVLGAAKCGENEGNNYDYTWPRENHDEWILSSLNTGGGDNFCWCSVTGGILNDGIRYSTPSNIWVYLMKLDSPEMCDSDCTSLCARYLQTQNEFNKTMFQQLPYCLPYKYDVHYYCDNDQYNNDVDHVSLTETVIYGDNYSVRDYGIFNCGHIGESFAKYLCFDDGPDNTVDVDVGGDFGDWVHTDNVYCVAQWEMTNYRVAYLPGDTNNSASGGSPATGNMTGLTNKHYHDSISLPYNNPPANGFSLDGYEFAGWLCDNNIGLKAAGTTFSMPAANVTCTAQWNPNTIYLAWLLNGGTITGTNAPMCTYGTSAGQSGSITPIHDPTRNGYRFTGWTVNAGLPTGYARLSYLQSDGNQYIDTGIEYSTGADVVVKLKAQTDYSSDNIVLGFGNGSGQWFGVSSAGKWNIGPAPNYSSDVSASNVTDELEITWSGGIESLKINGISVTSNREIAVSPTDSLQLFGRNNAGSFRGRIYYVRVFQGGALQRNYIPVQYGNALGMFDTVTGEFFGNQGTGSFTG